MRSLIRFGVILGVVAWIFAVTLGYYVVHKPFSVQNALALLNAIGDLAVAGALVALGVALGRRMLRDFQFDLPLEALIFQASVGMGVLALVIFALGLIVLNRFLFWILLFAAAFILRDDLRAAWRDLRALALPIPERFERALAVFIAFALIVGGIAALMPPVAWDGQVHHLAQAELQIAAGRIDAPPDIPYFNFPALANMLYLAVMLLKGDSAVQVTHFSFLLLLLGAVFAFALRNFSARVAWVACALLVGVPSLLLVATWAYVDLALTFYAFAAFYALRLALERNDSRWFALAGACAGFAISVKYTTAIVPVALVLLILVSRGFALKPLLAFAATGGAVAAPYYIRAWIFSGNPVYPFVFGGKYWDAFRAQWFSRFGTGLMNSPLHLILAPWNATINSSEGAAGFEATIGPLLLILLPSLIIVRTQHATHNTHHVLRDLLLFALCLYLFWLFGVAGSALLIQTRLLFPAFPVFALLAAVALDRLAAFDLPQFSLARFARLVVLSVCGLTALSYALGFASDGALGYLAGAESRDAYLTRHLGGYYAALKFVNANLPKEARVLFLWEPRSYYADRAAQPDAILDAWAHLHWQYDDADSIAVVLRERGYTHVLLSRAGLDFMLQTGNDPISPEDIRALEEFASRHLHLVYGKTPLQITIRNGKPAVLNASEEPYAVYEILGQSK